jgi:hypothetical protein
MLVTDFNVKHSRIGFQCHRNTKPHSCDIAVYCRSYSSNAPSLGMRRLGRRVLHIRWLRIQHRRRFRRLVDSTANKYQIRRSPQSHILYLYGLQILGHLHIGQHQAVLLETQSLFRRITTIYGVSSRNRLYFLVKIKTYGLGINFLNGQIY